MTVYLIGDGVITPILGALSDKYGRLPMTFFLWLLTVVSNTTMLMYDVRYIQIEFVACTVLHFYLVLLLTWSSDVFLA